MEDLSRATVPLRCSTETFEPSKDFEGIIEGVQNISVQLTWMAYDTAKVETCVKGARREACLCEPEEAHRRCRAAVFGEAEPQPVLSHHKFKLQIK